MASSTGTGAGVFQTSPTITTPTIDTITSAASTALTLKSAGTTAITVDTSQNVGIGTTSPSTYSAKLAVVASSGVANQWLVGGASSGAYAYFSNNAQSSTANTMQIGQGWTSGSDNIGFLNTNGANPILFATNGAERMRIDSSGNLLVGTTTSTTEKLRIFQSAANSIAFLRNSNATTVYGIQIEYSARTPNTTGEEFIYCGDTAPRFTARSNGGIANYSANNVNLSDRREKTNFSPSKSYLDVICAIPVQTFNYIDQNMETDGGLTLGVIAQDVQAVAPELVMESNWASRDQDPKMRLSIYQTDLQYALMKSIQELKAINDTQAETINALTARIVALENR
jgi:hypothetical protein